MTGNRAEGGAGGAGGADFSSGIPGAGGAGGPARGGAILNAGQLRLVRTVVSGNVAQAGRGGAAGNGGSSGGGGTGGIGSGGAIDSTGSGTVTLVDSTVRDNVATGGDGGDGAMAASGQGGMAAGGGIFSGGASVTVDGSTVSGNVARAGASVGGTIAPGGRGEGGGLRVSHPFVVRDSTVAGNSVLGGAAAGPVLLPPVAEGGGIWSGSTATLERVTIAGNAAGEQPALGRGGNLRAAADGAVQARGVLIAGGVGGPESANCNRPLDARGGNVEQAAAGECGAELTVADAKRATLAANGGATETIALSPGSPAHGAGSCTDLSDAPVTRDQRGWPRPLTGCDAGAYEAVPPVVAAGAASDVGTTTATLNGTVRWLRAGATTRFSYGVADVGEQPLPERAAPIAEAEPAAVSEPLTGLRPGTTYRFRLTVAGPDGDATAEGSFTTAAAPPGGDPPRADPPRADPPRADPPRGDSPRGGVARAPLLTRVAVVRRAGRSTLRFTLDRAARVTVLYTRPAAGRRRARVVGRVTLRGRKGVNKVALNRRVGKRVLAPGRYRLTLTATAGRLTGRARTASLTIARGAKR